MIPRPQYKILDLIDRNRSDKVFAALDYKTGQLVALKKLDCQRLFSKDCLRKLRCLFSLSHPHIVNCRSLEQTGKDRYLVMDYCAAGTLRESIDSSEKLSWHQSLQLIIDILSGLQYAHERGVIHGNIRPEHILLNIDDRGWTAQIANFGSIESESNNLESLAYKAPEHFAERYLGSGDLYAVGIILFELIVGQHPFAEMAADFKSAHLHQPVIIPDSVPLALHPAIATALEKDPRHRFLSASEMLRAVRLAQNILAKTHPSNPLLSPRCDRTFKPLKILATEKLSRPITHLAVASEQLYWGGNNRLQARVYRDNTLTGEAVQSWQIPLDGQLSELNLIPQGCLATTAASIYYLPHNTDTEAFRFFSQTFLPIITVPTRKLVTAIDPQGHWLGMSYSPTHRDNAVLEILQLPSLKVISSQTSNRLYDRLIALDRRYGLAIFQDQQEETTNLHLFNRRGNWLGNFSIPLVWDLVTYNPLFPQRLMAIEPGNPGVALLIALKPLEISRIAIPIIPEIIIPHPQGYLLGDRLGKMVLVNGRDNNLTLWEILLKEAESVKAIAAITNSQLLVATQANLYRIETKNH